MDVLAEMDTVYVAKYAEKVFQASLGFHIFGQIESFSGQARWAHAQ